MRSADGASEIDLLFPAGAEPAAAGAGHLRVYLAAAAGAGKTIAMLDEGQRRRALGSDVVIAVVEDHDRPLTWAHAAGLEIVPRRASEAPLNFYFCCAKGFVPTNISAGTASAPSPPGSSISVASSPPIS